MGKHRKLKKVGVIISILIAIYMAAALGCRDKSNHSPPKRTSSPVTSSADSESKQFSIGSPIRSADGKYEATKVSDGNGGVHYRVTRSENRKVVLTTNSKYPGTPNDAKAGRFSPDSTKFATAYHYGEGQEKYTWIGVWDLEAAERIREESLEGVWNSSIPNSVFEEQKATAVDPKDDQDKPSEPKQWDLHSPDGKYGATRIRHQGGFHFQVGEVESGRVVFTTHGQYSTPNNVKTGRFSPDSTNFAAAYHYGHAGNYTWVGIWSLKTERRIRSKRLSGWSPTIPTSVFEEDEGS